MDGAGQILACAAVAEKYDECLPCLPHVPENDPLRFAPNPPPASPPTPVVPPLVSPDTEPPISPSPPPNPAPSDYSIRILLESSMCLDVKHGSMEAGSTLLLWECTDRPASNQQFYYDTSDSTIRAKDKPELCVNAHGGGLASKDIVGLWTCSADVNEQWTLPGDGTIRVKSKPTLCINADGGYVKGTDIILYECTSPPSSNEQWQSVTVQ